MSVDLYEREREELEPRAGLETVKLLREVKEQITWTNSCMVQEISGMTEDDVEEDMSVADLVKLATAMDCEIKIVRK